MPYATVVTDQFPVVLVTFTGEKPTPVTFAQYLQDVRNCYSKGEKLTLIFDATHVGFPGFTYQKIQAEWLKVNESLMKEYCMGTAYVIPSVVIKWALNLIFFLQSQPVPYIVCANLDEARQWAQQQLQPGRM
jgi:hypothetical protein